MGKIIKTDEIAGLRLDERLDLVEAIWASIEADSDILPLPDWHREELDKRLAAHVDDPSSGEEWSVVRKRLLGRLQRR